MADNGNGGGTDGQQTALRGGTGWLGAIVRFIVSAIVLMVVSFITPGMSGLGFWNALLAAVVIAIVGYLLEALFGRRISPYGRGGVGFVVSAIVFYLVQFVVPGMRVTILGALIAAFIVGIIDMFVPTELR